MIGVIATVRVHDGKGAEFEAFFEGLARQVRASEPGCLTYNLTRSRTEPGVYKVLEVYKDQDAVTKHSAADYHKAAQPAFASFLAGRPDIEFLDAVV